MCAFLYSFSGFNMDKLAVERTKENLIRHILLYIPSKKTIAAFRQVLLIIKAVQKVNINLDLQHGHA
jgi:hypothetical protein